MIVKIKYSKQGWSYFEADNILVKTVDDNDRTKCDIFIKIDDGLKKSKKLIVLNNHDNNDKRIFTTEEVFILNKYGKTIEKLN